jgi:hypothetical protein
MITIGFCNKQMKDNSKNDQSYSKPGIRATTGFNNVFFIVSGLKYCDILVYFKIKIDFSTILFLRFDSLPCTTHVGLNRSVVGIYCVSRH